MNDIEKAVNLVTQAVAQFTGQLPKMEEKLQNEITTLVKQFRTDANGNIATSVDNLKLLNTIKVKLGKLLKNDEYVKDVAKFAKAFKSLEKFQDAYFTDIGSISKKGLLKEVGKTTVNSLVDELVGTGLDRVLSRDIIGELRTAILAGDSYSELVKKLQGIQSTSVNAGLLSKHSGTYARDAINDFMGERNKIIGEDLGLEWYMYVGSNLTTTREFCEHLTKKKYVHKSEIPTILEGDIDGHQCEIYAKTGLPLGLKDGTTPENFIVHRGGWNCGHQLVPVAPEAVPADAKAKIEAKQTPPAHVPKPFVMDEKAIDLLNKAGFMDGEYKLDKSDIQKYNDSPIAGFNLPEFNNTLEEIFKSKGISITKREMNIAKDEVKFSFSGKVNNANNIYLERTFRIENGEKAVHHDFFTLPESVQGKGISKEVFRALYEQYRNAGVTKIDVLANINVGGYTWAKYGFTASKDNAREILRRFNSPDKKTAESIINDFYLRHSDVEPFPMNLLTGYAWSEGLLKGRSWNGVLDLKNDIQRDVFEKYIKW